MERLDEFRRTHPDLGRMSEQTVAWITQNNWILPIREDEELEKMGRFYIQLEQKVFAALGLEPPARRNRDHVQWVREYALQSMFAWESTPIWESMKPFFWDHFAWQKHRELKKLACALGLPVKRSQADQATVLIDYFNSKVGI